MITFICSILCWIVLGLLGLTGIGIISTIFYSPKRVKEFQRKANELKEDYNKLSWLEKRKINKEFNIESILK